MNAPDTRERSASGIVPALIVPAMMSSSINPIPDRNSEPNRNARTSQRGPPAAGMRISGAGKRKQPATNAGPMPNRRATRAVTNEPQGGPNDPDPRPVTSVPGPPP